METLPSKERGAIWGLLSGENEEILPKNRNRRLEQARQTYMSLSFICQDAIIFTVPLVMTMPPYENRPRKKISFPVFATTAIGTADDIGLSFNLFGGHSIAPKTTSANAASASP